VIRIFVSHSSRDLAIVEPIKAQAEAIEVEVYLHELHAEPGANLSVKIMEAIKSSDALVVLVTPNTVVSPYVNQEIGYALGQSIPVIPVVSPGVGGERLAMLEGAEYVLFDPERPHESAMQLTAQLHLLQTRKTAHAEALKQTELQAALRRQQELSVALGFVCVLLILYIATSGGGPGSE
jgi:nucleoside 2-deoxyribosyltransferase